MSKRALAGVLAVFTILLHSAHADEGMWLYSALPLKQLHRDYGFNLSKARLNNLMRSDARFNSGGNSGSFVSADGLWLTNFHIARPMVRSLKEGARYIEEGFFSIDPDESLKIPNAELRSPESIEDVTDQVLAAVRAGASETSAAAARNGAMADIEIQSQKKTGLHSQVIALYSGARYELYRYRTYSDVRLVFIPEEKIGMLDDPGDSMPPDEPDAFNFDISLFRVYENGKPLKTPHFLKWSSEPVTEGELLMGIGDPGFSELRDTVAQNNFQRDAVLPLQLEQDRRVELAMTDASERNVETAARFLPRLKAMRGDRIPVEVILGDLDSAVIMSRKIEAEKELRKRLAVADSPAARGALRGFEKIDKIEQQQRLLYTRYFLFEAAPGFGSVAFNRASALMNLKSATAATKSQWRDAWLKSARSPDPELDQLRLNCWLDMMAGALGADEPAVQLLLKGHSPRERAEDLMKQTRVFVPEYLKGLLDEVNTGEDSDDVLVEFARAVEANAVEIRTRYEANEEDLELAKADIEGGRLSVQDGLYPDATNTPRFSYGTVTGRAHNGLKLSAWSTFGQMYGYLDHQIQREPLTLPKRWQDKREVLNPNAQFNFFTNIHIVGGSSGTPVVNRKGEFVGVLDAGNTSSDANSYFYDASSMRSVAISSGAIIEALHKVYGADSLVVELLHGHR